MSLDVRLEAADKGPLLEKAVGSGVHGLLLPPDAIRAELELLHGIDEKPGAVDEPVVEQRLREELQSLR